ncbi:MAG: hypothetical protein WC781_04645 [Candidatus Pacearchaeota archaeon]|jgi:cellobiose-specific phosphotransferase system component IIA
MSEKQIEYSNIVHKAGNLESQVREALKLVRNKDRTYKMIAEAKQLYEEATKLAEEMGNQQEAGFWRENAGDCNSLRRAVSETTMSDYAYWFIGW